MILAIDVHYREQTAKVVCAVLKDWKDPAAMHYWIKYVPTAAEYIPGSFYKRELPCILSILEDIDLQQVQGIVIDGFVVLDDTGKPGLGAHLYESLLHKVPVIGVAKSNFYQNSRFVIPVQRGESAKPLFVTAMGTNLQQAAENIKAMPGEFRIPDVLKELDKKTKEA